MNCSVLPDCSVLPATYIILHAFLVRRKIEIPLKLFLRGRIPGHIEPFHIGQILEGLIFWEKSGQPNWTYKEFCQERNFDRKSAASPTV